MATRGYRRVINIANLMTLLRMLLVPVVIALIWTPTVFRLWFAASFVIFAGITDLLDGYLARKFRVESIAGKILDPIADKVLVLSVLVVLVQMQRVHVIPVLLLIAREIVVTGIRAVAAGEGLIIAAGKEGKFKTWFQMWAISCLVIHDEYLGASAHEVGLVLLYISLYFSLLSGYEYVMDYVRVRLKHSPHS
ncbi:MAG: CDP-diacylglycerol--glycerol-3-phosphate 3-phosphatidyltransferase [Deltaproteobacteria bacterium]|nr:CDP-diacylglycerol--glycerol-3-phosphate 3-phosphatidyltransferase [Deltaproteobacteria bacterium]